MKSKINTYFLYEFIQGAKSSIPIFIGYFTASIAFGILALSSGLAPFEAVLFSMTNLTGAAQFMAINLIASSAAIGEIVISVMLMNMRYFIMSASLARKLGLKNNIEKAVISFGVTDEIFSVASLKSGKVASSFMYGLQLTSYMGWALGTLTGVTVGMFLPRALQDAMSGALFALFISLLIPEIKKSYRAAILAVSAGILNSLLYYIWNMSAGWSIVISMITITAMGAAFYKNEDNDSKGNGNEAIIK
jgi:4-azaleucine resistance transporter AzlC